MNALWYEAAGVAMMSYAEGKCRKLAPETADEEANRGRFSGSRRAVGTSGYPLAIQLACRPAAVNIADEPTTGKINIPNMEVDRDDEHRDP